MDLTARDSLIRSFRQKVYAQTGFVPFEHQADWQLASEGLALLPYDPAPGAPSVKVRLPDKTIVTRAVTTRPSGGAKVLADLAAYKTGKSYGLAHWLAGFALVPSQIHLVGLEYGTAEPEFTYLLEALISERGMRMKYHKLHNDKRGGRMILKLNTGCTYEVKSWNQKESLKGQKILCYAYCEAYQLPGLECFTTVSQNLRELQGWAVFATTPDRPWVSVFHKFGHGADPNWHCTCGIDAKVNPFTYDQRARDRDDPMKGGIMTRERYAIAWCGQMGAYVGSVYDFIQGQRLFTPMTHPHLFDRDLLHSEDALPSPSPPAA